MKARGDVMAVIASNATLPRKALQELVGEQTGTWLSLSHIYELASAYKPAQLGLGLAPSLPGPAAEEEEAPSGGEGTEDDGDVAGTAQAAPSRDDGATIVGAEEEAGADGDVAGPVRDDSVTVAGGSKEPEGREPGDEPEGASGQNDSGEAVFEPPAELPGRASGRYMGLALYYPALAAVGLLEAARAAYKLPRSARFGVRATFLCLFFMTLLSKTTLEAAKHLRRPELGAVVGSSVAPCVKTLRRKLASLVDQSGAAKLGELLARHWVGTGFVATAYLYIDI